MSASLTRTQRDQVRWKGQCLSLIGHLFFWSVKSCTSFTVCLQCPTRRVFSISGQVLERIPGSRSGSGWAGVLNYSIGYFLVLYLRSGISGYYGYYLSFGGIEPNEYGVLYLKYSLRSRYTRNFWVYPTFRVSWYPIIFKTETGQVEFAKKVKWRTGIRNLEVFRPKMLIGKCPKFSLF